MDERRHRFAEQIDDWYFWKVTTAREIATRMTKPAPTLRLPLILRISPACGVLADRRWRPSG